jgi:CDP-6-deoxy-D-xylo-4-hexulose-3-dehydrase
MTLEEQRRQILSQVRDYAAQKELRTPFVAGQNPVPPSGRVLDAEAYVALVDAALDGWLTTGRFNDEFEKQIAARIGVARALTVNSGSSANLLALSALTSPLLGERALQPGDEVITAAAGFPTTINPILQNSLVPVFVDSTLPTYNPSAATIAAAIGPRTRAIMLAHALGNPFEAAALRALADQHGLWLIEDCCDAFGATYNGRNVGTFGHIGTLSFYPAHHVTTGEGGAVFTDDPVLARAIESFRDWGRDCYCAPGKDNTCGKRFDWQLGKLPCGYDHKDTYSHAGYNLKITDMQAAVGCAQLDKLPEFIAARKRNHARLMAGLKKHEDKLILHSCPPKADPAWFGFVITVRPGGGVERNKLTQALESAKIETRNLFCGNLLRHPAYEGIEHRVAGTLANSDLITTNTFFIGVYPGLTDAMIDHMIAAFDKELA